MGITESNLISHMRVYGNNIETETLVEITDSDNDLELIERMAELNVELENVTTKVCGLAMLNRYSLPIKSKYKLGG